MTDARHHEFMSTSARDARRSVVAEMGDCEPAAAQTELLVSELVTNAMVHAGDTEVPVSMEQTADHVRISVADSSPTAPTPRDTGPEAPGGHGLQIVESLASEWGVEQHPDDGKSVWFEVDCSEPR